MASANLDLVRSIYAGWGRGDFSAAEWADPEIEWVTADGPNPGTSTGLEGMARSFRDFATAWEHYRVEVDEYRELDHERILVLVDYRGRGRTSGLELGRMRARQAQLLHIRDGRVTRFVSYWDRARALADLGLAAEAGSP